MSNRIERGVKMLDRETIEEPVPCQDAWQDALIEVDHVTLLQCLRQVNAQLTRELVAAGGAVSLALSQDGVPVPIQPRRLCDLMQPFLCMN